MGRIGRSEKYARETWMISRVFLMAFLGTGMIFMGEQDILKVI